MNPKIPSLMILVDLEPCVESRRSNDTAIVRSNGVARPSSEGTSSTYMTSTDRICSCCSVGVEIRMSAILLDCFFVLPFKDAMSL